jgi:type IV pilus biogenesis protein CpaD/CtpE
MIRAIVIAAGMAVLLGGCADGAANLGTPPPVALRASQQELIVPYQASRVSQLRLRRSIDALAEGNLQAVRARIVATNVAQANGVRRALIGIGLDPTRITGSIVPSRRVADATVVLFRATAITSDCAAAIALAFPDDPAPSLLSLSRCTQNSNLAAMVVDPADLVAPPALGHADGASLANGVQAWRGNRRTSLPGATTSGSADSGGAASTGSPAAPTTTPAPAPVVSTPNTTTQTK